MTKIGGLKGGPSSRGGVMIIGGVSPIGNIRRRGSIKTSEILTGRLNAAAIPGSVLSIAAAIMGEAVLAGIRTCWRGTSPLAAAAAAGAAAMAWWSVAKDC